MRFKSALLGLAALGAAIWCAAPSTPTHAMGALGPSAAAGKSAGTLVEQVHRKWRRRAYRGYGYYPRHRHHRRYYYSYGAPYYAPYYRPYYYGYPYYPYYGGYYYRPRVYGFGVYGPRFGVRIGF